MKLVEGPFKESLCGLSMRRGVAALLTQEFSQCQRETEPSAVGHRPTPLALGGNKMKRAGGWQHSPSDHRTGWQGFLSEGGKG